MPQTPALPIALMREARLLAVGGALFLIVAPLLAVCRQVAILVVGAGLNGAARLAETSLLPALPVDPVYGGAGLRVLGGIHPYGLAVAGSPGWWLHYLAPGIFSDAVLVANGAIVSALVEPGATVLARLLTGILTTSLLVALVGLVAPLARQAAPPRPADPSAPGGEREPGGAPQPGDTSQSGVRWLALGALAVAARLGQVWLLLDLAHEADLSLRDLEATGLPFALAAFAPVDRDGQRVLLTTQLEDAPVLLVSAGNAVLAIAACLLLAWLLVKTVRGAQWLGGGVWRLARTRGRWSRSLRPGWRRSLPRVRLQRRRPVVSGVGLPVRAALAPGTLARRALLLGLPVALSLSPLGAFAEGEIATLSVHLTETPAYTSQAYTVAVADDADLAEPPDVESTAIEAAPPAVAGALAASDPSATPSRTPQEAAPVPVAPAAVASSTAPGAAAPPQTPPMTPTMPPTMPPVAHGGSLVTLEGANYRYRLSVDGRPWVVRGMGYNPWYADLPAEERRALYRRDFSLMRETGVNTLEGWFQGQFDEVTLDEAHRQGLKVILPFELNQDYDYADPAIQARFRSEVTDWVLRYRDHPAVLMWGPGNEVLHRLIFPTAVQGKRDPSRENRADDFARFYVELMDLVHQLDPQHPVIYRDAEDLYLARFLAQLQQRPAERPWFVYGTNVYTSRIAEVIERWPSRGIDAPLLVSEFSPGGTSAADRPVMLGWYWSTIRAHPERVLGGVVYTWATRGPEDLDRVFGLTNEAGAPVDGSLGALRQLFRPAARPPLTSRTQGR